MHVKKGHIEENSVERLLQIVKAGGSQRAMPRKRAGKTTLIEGSRSGALFLVATG